MAAEFRLERIDVALEPADCHHLAKALKLYANERGEPLGIRLHNLWCELTSRLQRKDQDPHIIAGETIKEDWLS